MRHVAGFLMLGLVACSGSSASSSSSSTGASSVGSTGTSTTGSSTGSTGTNTIGTSASSTSTSSSSSSSGSSGTTGACAFDSPGATFTFHVHNAGTTSYRLTYGCGGTLPIVVNSTQGSQPISPGPADYCEHECDSVYAGTPAPSCSDCGPGYGADLPAGATVDIAWDRRVYTAFTVDPVCSGNNYGNNCALGTAVAPTATQSGTLTVCAANSGTAGAGYCSTSSETPIAFTVDSTGTGATVTVN